MRIKQVSTHKLELLRIAKWAFTERRTTAVLRMQRGFRATSKLTGAVLLPEQGSQAQFPVLEEVVAVKSCFLMVKDAVLQQFVQVPLSDF